MESRFIIIQEAKRQSEEESAEQKIDQLYLEQRECNCKDEIRGEFSLGHSSNSSLSSLSFLPQRDTFVYTSGKSCCPFT